MIDDVVRLLEANGYTRNAQTVSVAGIEFRFDAVLSGPGNQNGLIVLTVLEGDAAKLRRRISNLCTALIRTESHRPVTAVVLAADGAPGVDLDAVCSTFVLTSLDNPDVVLAPLLPLQLPAPSVARENAETLLRMRLGETARDHLTSTLLTAARLGVEEVAEVLRETLSSAATSDLDAGEGT